MTSPAEFVAYLKKIAKQFPTLGLLTMLGEAAKPGAKDKTRTFNLARSRTCCAIRPDGSMISTWVCRGACYAIQMAAGRKGVLQRALKNWFIVQRPDRVELIAGAIHLSGAEIIRFHDFGDFFSADYARDWCAIVRLCPNVEFLVMTRAWRDPLIAAELRVLAAEPNVCMLTSHDRESAGPSGIPGTREAWLMDSDGTPPPRKVWVAFRASREKKNVELKRAGESLVCPAENGTGVEITCDKCRHCFFKGRQK